MNKHVGTLKNPCSKLRSGRFLRQSVWQQLQYNSLPPFLYSNGVIAKVDLKIFEKYR